MSLASKKPSPMSVDTTAIEFNQKEKKRTRTLLLSYNLDEIFSTQFMFCAIKSLRVIDLKLKVRTNVEGE
jgi:hypothetical protein